MSTNDVSLDDILKNAFVEDTVAPTDGASADEGANEKGEEQVQESDRAQTRIRELARENKSLKGDDLPYNSTDEFLDAVADTDSRNLLKTFATLQRRELDSKLDPFTKEKRANEFDSKFDDYASKIPGLDAHKSDLKLTFSRNPNMTPEQLIGQLVLSKLTNAKPKTETRSAQVGRTGVPNIDDMSKDDLYAYLESNR